jgi:hypothetical protein
MARPLLAMAAALGISIRAPAGDAPPSGAINSSANPPSLSDVSSTPPANLERVEVRGERERLPGFLGRIFGYSWNVSENWGSNFHIRGGQLVDAIGFRHDYLQSHPGEKATVVVVTRPPNPRVTQAVVVYTSGGRLRLESVATGDIQAWGLTAADIDRPEVLRKYVEGIRDTYLMGEGFSTIGDAQNMFLDTGTGVNIQTAAGQTPTIAGLSSAGQVAAAENTVDSAMLMALVQDVKPSGGALAVAEETGDYSKVWRGHGVDNAPVYLYPGSSDDMLTSAFHWLNDENKVGLIPVARGRVKVDLSHLEGRNKGAPDATQSAVVFDWDGVHYMYTDQFGTLGMPFPRNPVTGAPYLVLKNGDLLESLYFVATFARKFPNEKAALVPPVDGVHAAAIFTQAGHIWMMSPFLGRFELPDRYKSEHIGAISKLHDALIARELKKLPPGVASLPATGLPQALPGDSSNEQVRRAYLAFKELGIPGGFVVNEKNLPGLKVSYQGAEYSYFAPD